LNVIADKSNEVFVSAATVWELGIKQSKGKLKLGRSVFEQMTVYGFVELPISFRHAEKAAGLQMMHGDPFDRMLVAQAIVEGMTLVTADRVLAEYPAAVLRV
jgi:PIN domain nuclease of toxin-antitoxin system